MGALVSGVRGKCLGWSSRLSEASWRCGDLGWPAVDYMTRPKSRESVQIASASGVKLKTIDAVCSGQRGLFWSQVIGNCMEIAKCFAVPFLLIRIFGCVK